MNILEFYCKSYKKLDSIQLSNAVLWILTSFLFMNFYPKFALSYHVIEGLEELITYYSHKSSTLSYILHFPQNSGSAWCMLSLQLLIVDEPKIGYIEQA